eukprot:1731318-Amphidinium_carterae.1
MCQHMLAARNAKEALPRATTGRLVYVSEEQYEAYYGMYAGRAFHASEFERSKQSAPSGSASVSGAVG